MDSICAWCHVPLWDGGSPAAASTAAEPVSHGICQRCLAQAVEMLAEPFVEFLEGLPAPVLVVDANGCVQAANALACAALGRPQAALLNLRGGDAIGCVHSFEPGGCGQQYHCRTCAIRRAVTHTAATGEALSDVHAWPDTQHGQERKTLSVVLSTCKLGELVLLQLDELDEVSAAAATLDLAVAAMA